MSNPWRCPNNPPCPHPGLLHDIEDLEDTSPTCCAEGCKCGRDSASLDQQASTDSAQPDQEGS